MDDDSKFLENCHYQNVRFGNSNYTLGYVLKKLVGNNIIDQFEGQHFSKIQIDEIGIDRGFCSRVFKVELEFGKKFVKKSARFIVKISTNERWAADFKTDEVAQIDSEKLLEQMHNCECEAFELMNPMKHHFIPQAYYIERSSEKLSGLIVMEDMSIQNKMLDVFESATLQQCFDLVEKIAIFQTQFNFLPDKDEWVKRLSSYNIQTSTDMNLLWAQNIKSGFAIDNQVVQAQIRKFLTYDLQKINKYVLQECSAKTNSNTICRGELWAGNVMLNDNETKIGGLLDFQTMMIGNPLYDLCCFIVFCTNGGLRMEYERKIIDFYYHKLCVEYAKYEAFPSFTYQQAHKYYDYVLLHTAGHQIQIFTVQALQFQHSTDPVEIQKFKDLFDRLCMSMADVQCIISKYKLENKFCRK